MKKLYDITEAKYFLEAELEMTPAEMLDEVRAAICLTEDDTLYGTLLSVADLLEKIEEVS